MRLAEEMARIDGIESKSPSTSNPSEDALSQVLGPDKPGRLRGMGRGISLTKYSYLQARDKHVIHLEEVQGDLKPRIHEFENLVHEFVGHRKGVPEGHENQNSNTHQNTSIHCHASAETSKVGSKYDTCKLLDWCGISYGVAKGRYYSSDPYELKQYPLGT